jgi:hypothetical protein
MRHIRLFATLPVRSGTAGGRQKRSIPGASAEPRHQPVPVARAELPDPEMVGVYSAVLESSCGQREAERIDLDRLGLLLRYRIAWRRAPRLTRSGRETIAEHRETAKGFRLGRLVLKDVPVLGELAVFEAHDIGGDP